MKFTNKNIILDTDPNLRKKSALVEFPLSNEDLQTLIGLRQYVMNSIDEDMCEKYDLSPAVGIAAPQVGVMKRMCVVFIESEDGNNFDLSMINPRIMSHSTTTLYIENGEACLSIKDEHIGNIHRPNYIKVRYQDLNGNFLIIELDDFPSIAVQHEIDHLNGILYYDHISLENPLNVPKNSHPL